jgi:hypothetical protein
MNIPEHISDSLDVDPDPGSVIFMKTRSWMEKFGSGMNIPDPQHCRQQNKRGGQEKVHGEERRPGNTRTKEYYERDKLAKAASKIYCM